MSQEIYILDFFARLLFTDTFLGENVFSVKAISYGAQDVQKFGKRSQLIIDNTYNIKLSGQGHHVISFDMTTGM